MKRLLKTINYCQYYIVGKNKTWGLFSFGCGGVCDTFIDSINRGGLEPI